MIHVAWRRGFYRVRRDTAFKLLGKGESDWCVDVVETIGRRLRGRKLARISTSSLPILPWRRLHTRLLGLVQVKCWYNRARLRLF
jgi:hypothetical protein